MMLVLLQNAWSPIYAGVTWPRESWLGALWRSPTGRKLALHILRDIPETSYYPENTTDICGEEPDSVVKADIFHVLRTIDNQHVTSVLACGKQADAVAHSLWRGPITIIPHPACRLTKASMSLFNSQIKNMISETTRESSVVRCRFTTKGDHVAIK